MITEHDLQEAIAECEGQRNPSSSTCMKLAAFYTIRDKLYPVKQEEVKTMPGYSMSSGPVEPDTEFMQIARTLDQQTLLVIMDELMTTLQALMPRLYDGVMRRLKQ